MSAYSRPRPGDTCTVLTGGTDPDYRVGPCGKPAVALLHTWAGDTYAECRDHTTDEALAELAALDKK